MKDYEAGCPNGHSVWWGARYCGECGTQCINKARFCEECWSKLASKEKFCTRCGHEIGQKPKNIVRSLLKGLV